VSQPFEVFGPYAVYERLGQGGMASVHRAEKRGVGIRRPVALKRLLPHVAADPALVELFVNEARLASRLHHANVAQTYELGKVGDTFFIAMEYASGPTLGQIVRQCQAAAGDIPLTVTVAILQQVCEALDYAHNLCDEAGQPLRLIHRDVSPANIIVTSTGVVKLIDFGIAKATISSVKTQTGFIKGKFGYIAPEYISGQIDARVDLFAVGVIAHELITGRRLFEGKDDFETLQNIRELRPLPPSHWNPHVPHDLDDIVMTALQRDPAQRWQSAGAMQLALAHVARGFGMVVSSQQLAEWVEWAFSQEPPDSGPVTVDAGDDSLGYRLPPGRPGSSLSIEVQRGSASMLETPPAGTLATDTLLPEPLPGVPSAPMLAPETLTPETPRPEPLRRGPSTVMRAPEALPPEVLASVPLARDTPRSARAVPSPRHRPVSDFDKTEPIERIELSRRDIEILTPTPAPEPMPALLARVPRASSPHDAVAAPRVPRASSPHDAVAAPRARTASQSPARSWSAELAAVPPPRAAEPRASTASPSPLRSRSAELAAVSPQTAEPRATTASPSPLRSRSAEPASVPPPHAAEPRASTASPSPLRSRSAELAAVPPPRTAEPLASPAPAPRRTSRVHDAIALPLPATPILRPLDALPVPPAVGSPRELKPLAVLRRPTSSRELVVPPAASEFPGPPTDPTTRARPPGKSRPAKATQKTRPQPDPARPTPSVVAPRAPRRRGNAVWLILLMIALGAAATAAAYYLPDL
jgi:serine/threonine protein kinase